MKELSIEEKAKRYDEAVERLRNAFYDNNRRMCEEYRNAALKIIEPIFPELAESKDERLRKALMQNLQERFGTKGNMGEGLDMPDVLAWLEKQGEKGTNGNEREFPISEQKPAGKVEPIEGEFPYNNPADTLEGEIDNIWRNVSCGNRFTATKEGFDEVIRHFINFVKQKPAWSEEDKRFIDNLISQLGNLCSRKLIKEETKDKYVNWLKSLRPQSQWKPSKEQIVALRWVLNNFPYDSHKEEISGLLEQLKKLREE